MCSLVIDIRFTHPRNYFIIRREGRGCGWTHRWGGSPSVLLSITCVQKFGRIEKKKIVGVYGKRRQEARGMRGGCVGGDRLVGCDKDKAFFVRRLFGEDMAPTLHLILVFSCSSGNTN